jgi:ParB-like chromosome segregation protein Spo0J
MNELIEKLGAELGALDLDARVEALNKIREALHDVSPFKEEPVDFVRWVKSDTVSANDYNPNSVAPPEMKLLELSILADGYTQPIVAFGLQSGYEVVDGFHRNRVGKESDQVRARVKGYLPVVRIKAEREDKGNRMAATIRHNRARGRHRVDSMAEIVSDLTKRNWSEKKISDELGMDQDEVLRLKQTTGLAELFADREFSEAWEIVEDTPE